jgi:hypothetical protein
MRQALLLIPLVLALAFVASTNEPDDQAAVDEFTLSALRIDQVHRAGRVHFAISGLDPDTVLSGTASTIAGRDVFVVCLRKDEPGYPYGAWGYVYLWGDNEYMAEEVCDGLHALIAEDSSVPAWKQGLGVLVLAHESFHLNQGIKEPESEARTECRAIKGFDRTVKLLGRGDADVERLLPYALAIHWRIAALAPEYFWKPCNVPNFWPPDES